MRGYVGILLAISLAGCGGTNSADDDAIFKAVRDDGFGGACENGGIATGDIVAVSADTNLLDAPNGSRIVNEKASAVLKETYYQQVDSTETLRETCRTDKWSKIQVKEPASLNHVEGWLQNSALRLIGADAAGNRNYVEADFYWDDDTSRYRPQLVAAVNRIVRENDNCLSVDPGTLSESGSRGTAARPVYFITCNGPNDRPFNVWFERDDATSGKSFAAIRNIDRGDAVVACERAAKAAANNPQTVDFSTFMDVAYLTYPNGRSRLLSSFTAKNAFGVEGKFTIGCLFEGQELIETVVNQAT